MWAKHLSEEFGNEQKVNVKQTVLTFLVRVVLKPDSSSVYRLFFINGTLQPKSSLDLLQTSLQALPYNIFVYSMPPHASVSFWRSYQVSSSHFCFTILLLLSSEFWFVILYSPCATIILSMGSVETIKWVLYIITLYRLLFLWCFDWSVCVFQLKLDNWLDQFSYASNWRGGDWWK